MGKYVPGSLWPVVMQAEMARRHGVPSRRTAGATMVSLLLGMLTGLAWFLVALPVIPAGLLAGSSAGNGWLAWLGLPLLAVLHPAVLGRILDLVAKLTRGAPIEQRPTFTGTLTAAAWSALSWVFAGVQVWAIAVSLGVAPSWSNLLLCIGGFCLAWVAGFVVFLAPAGAVAREAALVVVLSPLINPGQALVAVLMSRVIFTVSDLTSAGFGAVVGRGERRSAESLPSP